MRIVDGTEDGQGVVQGIGSIGDVLANGGCIHESFFLSCQLLCTIGDRLVEVQDVMGQSYCLLADTLEVVDRVKELLMASQANTFDLGFTILVIAGQALV